MKLLDLTIGTRHFYLPADTDFTELETRITNAVRDGGTLVEIPTGHPHPTTALITPATPVFLDHLEVTDDTSDTDELHSPLDFDISTALWST